MTTIHDFIIEKIQDDITKARTYGKDPYHFIFYNYRIVNGKQTGLRLTRSGLRILKKHFQAYMHPRKEDNQQMNTGLLAEFEKMRWPYYVDEEKVMLFTEEASMWYSVYDGNIQDFLDDAADSS